MADQLDLAGDSDDCSVILPSAVHLAVAVFGWVHWADLKPSKDLHWTIERHSFALCSADILLHFIVADRVSGQQEM